jgi:hypothetical protein
VSSTTDIERRSAIAVEALPHRPGKGTWGPGRERQDRTHIDFAEDVGVFVPREKVGIPQEREVLMDKVAQCAEAWNPLTFKTRPE